MLIETAMRLLSQGADEHLMYTHGSNVFVIAGESVLYAINMLIFGSLGTSSLGFTPRNFFTLVFFSVFVVRFMKHFHLSYFLLGFAVFIHNSYGLMTLLILVASDLIIRPQIFFNFLVKLQISVLFTFLVWSEKLFLGSFLNEVWFLQIAPVLLVSVLTFATLSYSVFLNKSFFLTLNKVKVVNIMKGYMVPHIPLTDLLLLGVFFGATFFPFLLISQLSEDYYSNHYFWSQFHGRLIGIFRPCIFFTLLYTVFKTIEPRKVAKKIKFFWGAMLIICLVSTTPAKKNFQVNQSQMTSQIRIMDNLINDKLFCPISKSEHIVYYSLVKALLLRVSFVDTGDWDICNRPSLTDALN